MMLNERECDVAAQDPATVRRLASRLQRLANDCDALGITIFGGSGSGSLRAWDGNRPRELTGRLLILASIEGPFDGGDGGSCPDDDGLERGE